MYNNGYLVPANTKKSMLILGMMRPLDLGILIVGIVISVILLAILQDASTLVMILACVPMTVGLILVLPIPYYHNTLVALQSIYRFYNERRNYIWKGWCIYNEFENNK